MSEIVVDALMQNCVVFKLPERQLVSTYQHNSQVFALWYRDSSFPVDPLLEQQVSFGVVRFTFGDDGEFKAANEDTLVLDFTDRSAVEARTMTSHLLHDGRIVFSFSEKFSDGGKWGNHNYVLAYDIENAIWEIGHNRSASGDISFKPWSSGMGSREELSIEYGELKLFVQNGKLKVGIDSTYYHLDDWVRNDDYTTVAPDAEPLVSILKRKGAIFVTENWSGNSTSFSDYGTVIELPNRDTTLKAHLSAVPCWIKFENIREQVVKHFDEMQLFNDLCYQAQHTHRDEDRKKMPEIKTLSQEEKGVPFTGKLSDLLLSHPSVEAPPKYALIPVARYSDSVSVRQSSGTVTAALVLDVLQRTSCVMFVPIPELPLPQQIG